MGLSSIAIVNPYTLSILIAARPKDSIRAIAQRIGLSYGWTYKWAHELIRMGAFKAVKSKIVMQEKNAFYQRTMDYVTQIFNDVQFYYSALQLFGIQYCFTKTDAVFVWTKGGYNIGRSREYYPIFVKIKIQDRALFEFYCTKLRLHTAQKGIFYVPEFVDNFPVEFCEGVPVDPLDDTITFMKIYIYNFQPALEMVSELYGKQLDVKYREVR